MGENEADEVVKGGEILFCGATCWDAIGRKKILPETNLPSPTRLRPLLGVDIRLVVSSGASCHCVALDVEGRCYTWGRNEEGQLGHEDTIQRDRPTLVSELLKHKIVGAASGRSHTVVVTKDGKSFSFGWNKHGQLGSGSARNEIESSPVRCAVTDDVKTVACGAEFTVWLSSAEGASILTAGLPQYGQLGHGTDNEYNNKEGSVKVVYEAQPRPKAIAALAEQTIVKVACGTNHTVAVDSNGYVYTWGFGGHGRLGHGEQKDEWAPRRVDVYTRGNMIPANAVVAAGSVNSSCTAGGGQLYMWGKIKNDDYSMYPKPVMDLSGRNIHCMHSGSMHHFVGADNSCISWGDAQSGELGYGPNAPKSSAIPKKVDILDGMHVISVACGLAHSMVVVDRTDIADRLDQLEVYDGKAAEEGMMFEMNYNKEEPPFAGLKNLGATCYLNAFLQTLFHIPCFKKAIQEMRRVKPGSILAAMKELFNNLQKCHHSSVSTNDFIKSLGWTQSDVWIQHDVHEFSTALFAKLEEETKGTCDEGLVQRFFEGHSRTFIDCINVQYKYSKKESFRDIQLNVQGCTDPYSSFNHYIKKERFRHHLSNNLQSFMRCEQEQDADKWVLFTDFPPVLILQLKRFTFDTTTNSSIKINDRYELPPILYLDEYLAPEGRRVVEGRKVLNCYKLHSVLVHYDYGVSSSVDKGHYYAFIKLSDKWFKFDDQIVTVSEEIPKQDLSNAYLLVYVREREKNADEIMPTYSYTGEMGDESEDAKNTQDANKQIKFSNAHIPDELILEIIMKLSSKHICRCRILSKNWSMRISSEIVLKGMPDYSLIVAKNSNERVDFYKVANNKCKKLDVKFFTEEEEYGDSEEEYGDSQKESDNSTTLIGVCNGLVMIGLVEDYLNGEEEEEEKKVYKQYFFTLFNPTVEGRYCFEHMPIRQEGQQTVFAFGFDDNDYKMVMLKHFCIEDGEKKLNGEARLFSITDCVWRDILSLPPMYSQYLFEFEECISSLSICSVTYWEGIGGDFVRSIIMFCFKTELFDHT